MTTLKEKYARELAKRGRESRVYRRFQLIGLGISQILHDEKHKALYIKLAKEHDADKLLKIAKEVAEKKDVKNRGAYFMAVVSSVIPANAGIRKRKALTK